MRQTSTQSVDDVAFRCLELFEVLGVQSNSIKRRYFLRAISPHIAQKVADIGADLLDWDGILNAAKRIESNQHKYGEKMVLEDLDKTAVIKSAMVVEKIPQTVNMHNRHVQIADVAPRSGNDKVSSAASVISEDAASISTLSTAIKDLCAGMTALQLSINTTANQGSGNSYGRYNSAGNNERPYSPTPRYQGNGNSSRAENRACFFCNEIGHIAYYCPKRATGQAAGDPKQEQGDSNGNQQGKEQGRQ